MEQKESAANMNRKGKKILWGIKEKVKTDVRLEKMRINIGYYNLQEPMRWEMRKTDT